MLSRLQGAPTARTADTKRRALCDLENSAPTCDPTPGLTSAKRAMKTCDLVAWRIHQPKATQSSAENM